MEEPISLSVTAFLTNFCPKFFLAFGAHFYFLQRSSYRKTLIAKLRGLYNVNYDEATHALREFLETTGLTVSLL